MTIVPIRIDTCTETPTGVSWELWGLYSLVVIESNCIESGVLFADPGTLLTEQGPTCSSLDELGEEIGLEMGELWEAFVEDYYDRGGHPAPDEVYFVVGELLDR